jgi:hypothetical protein
MRVEVGLLRSNILITAADGELTYMRGTGELFGAHLVVSGKSSARLSNVEIK